MATDTDPTNNSDANAIKGDEAFQQLLPELGALSVDELQAITVDIPVVVGTVVGSLPEILEYAADIQKAVPELDLAAIKKLEVYAYALTFAHARFLGTGEATNELQLAVEQGSRLRELLLADANTLAGRGFIEPTRLKQLQGGVGFNNIATDLTILSAVLKDSWEKIQGKTAVTLAEIEQALVLGQEIIAAVGLRAQGPMTVASATDLRIRAFTLLARQYDKVRRAVSFIRWDHGDTDKIAPSLYAGRGGRRRQPDEPVNPTPPVVVPPPPPPGPHPAATSAKPGDEAKTPANTPATGSGDSEPFLK